MNNLTCSRIAESMRTSSVSLAEIQLNLRNVGDRTTVRGISMAIERLEDTGIISRKGIRTYGLTPEGRYALDSGRPCRYLGH